MNNTTPLYCCGVVVVYREWENMKLSEKLFLWFSAMTAVMLAVLLILAGLHRQRLQDEADVLQRSRTEPLTEALLEPEESRMTAEMQTTAEAETETETETEAETETETAPQAVLDLSDQDSPVTDSKEQDPYPYYIKVNKTQNCVTIYEKDEAGEYSIPLKAMICSTGNATPLGVFGSKAKYEMKGLINGVYGQYATWITGNILFHSVPCLRKSKDSVSVRNYNQLGTTASAGCIRLTVADAKWIYDNCETGTLIEIYNDAQEELPLGKPEAIRLPEGSGWDPTDPDPDNPWHACEPSITAEDRIILYTGQPWMPAQDITTLDTCGNDITEKTEIIGEVDCDTPGSYQITFRVTDAIGRTASAECEYLVIPVPYPSG